MSTTSHTRSLSSPLSPAQSRRIFVDASYTIPTGGPEALLQLTLVFNKLFPQQTYIIPYREDIASSWNVLSDTFKYTVSGKSHFSEFTLHPQFKSEYPLASQIPIGHLPDIVAGDILILPEIFPCPKTLVAKGILVYIWILGANQQKMTQLVRSGECSLLSHNYWLSQNMGAHIPASSILRPYLSPSLLPHTPLLHSLALKEDFILIDNDTPSTVVETIFTFCVEFPCTPVVAKGFTRPHLLGLYARAKVVVDWCMRGSERMPIEAVVHGAILISSSCGCIQDHRDFPIPPRNIIPQGAEAEHKLLLKSTLARVLRGYYGEELEAYAGMRELYGRNLTVQSLEEEVRVWYEGDTQLHSHL